jgi:myosin heavy subunit
MHSVGVNTAEMRTIKRILSAILHLGNVNFKDNGEGQAATVDGDKARQHMEWACELLGIDLVSSSSSARMRAKVEFGGRTSFFVCG